MRLKSQIICAFILFLMATVTAQEIKISPWKKAPSGIKEVAFSQDGQTVALARDDQSIRLWSLTKGSKLRDLTHPGDITCIQFSPNSKILASGGKDKTIQLWSLATGTELKSLTHKKAVIAMAFTSDSKILASADGENVWLWSLSTGNSITYFAYAATKLAFNSDDSILVTSNETETKLWQLGSAQKKVEIVDGDDSNLGPGLRRFSFITIDENKNNIPIHEVLINGKKIALKDTFITDRDYKIEVRFIGYKTYTTELRLESGKKSFVVIVPIKKLSAYRFFTRHRKMNLDGIMYDCAIYADSKQVEPHQIVTKKRSVFHNYVVYVKPGSRNFRLMAGYLYVDKRFIRISGKGIRKFTGFSIPRFIQHLKRLTQESGRGHMAALEAAEKILKSFYWKRQLLKTSTDLEIADLIYTIERWYFPEERNQSRVSLLVDVLEEITRNK